METLHLYNSLTRAKEVFEPINPPFVGLYVCGPTVYGDAHLGHARSSVSFDILYRYLKHLGFKVRYVRNITDVGHLENDADEGEDKIAKMARLEKLEPMEVAQYYTDRYHTVMQQLNTLPPNIEPRATGHIPEQIAMIRTILEKGFAYEVNGSVYFDVLKYRESFPYGELSGRVNLDELLAGSRDLEGQSEKRKSVDFALWKKASPEHIMKWESPWSVGFPGWHIECSAMSTRYLGEFFDIHGGGMDLKFPHHEAEIAQTNACYGHAHTPNQAKVWMHNNMITVNGQKMGKSLGNSITMEQFFTGNHPLLEKAFSPMTIRFFILQSHYRSTLDFSSFALSCSEKGMRRLMQSIDRLKLVKPGATSTFSIQEWSDKLYAAMNDDLNTAVVLAHLFDLSKLINGLYEGDQQLNVEDLGKLQQLINDFVYDVLGLLPENDSDNQILEQVMNMVIEMRQTARAEKNYALSDQIRDRLKSANIVLQDGPEGTNWVYEACEL